MASIFNHKREHLVALKIVLETRVNVINLQQDLIAEIWTAWESISLKMLSFVSSSRTIDNDTWYFDNIVNIVNTQVGKLSNKF